MHYDFSLSTFFWLMVIASIVAMIGRFWRIPYALALVITGLAVGIANVLPGVELQPQILFTVFLPPLLFESAMTINFHDLRANWKPVGLFAFFGTILSTGLVGFALHWFLGLPLPICLVFGALISPTDPVSVIAVFKQLGVGKRLSLIMEAESLFNDGIAVVLFGILLESAMGQQVDSIAGIKSFVVVAAGGAAAGGIIGYTASRITQFFDDHLLEIMLTTIVAFGSYLAAEAFHMSGVMAVVTAGLVVGNYGTQTGMSPTTRLAVHSFWEYAAFAVNSLVFLLVGLEITVVDLSDAVPLIAVAAIIVIGARAVSIYALSPLLSLSGGNIPAKWRHVLFWGALKGALPMALVLGISATVPYGSQLLYMTFGVVLISLLLQGLTMKKLLASLGLIHEKDETAEYRRHGLEILACEAAINKILQMTEQKAISRHVSDSLLSKYQERIDGLESRMQKLAESDLEFERKMLVEARYLALIEEKNSFKDAMSKGLATSEELENLLAEVDRELDEVRQGL